jgi:hypothetical protein
MKKKEVNLIKNQIDILANEKRVNLEKLDSELLKLFNNLVKEKSQ